MPTENRSSNTEQMVSVPREWVEHYAGLLEERCAYEASERVQAVLAQPPAQHKGEPVAVLYADGSVLTKAECGDAFETCCKVETPLYTHAEAGEVERLRAELEKSKANSKQLAELDDAFIKGQSIKLRAITAQLAEREAALDALNEIATGYKRDLDEAHALLRGIHDGEISGFERYSKIEALLSASAEPSAPVERDDLTSMVDAAMVEMAGIHPPLKRSECERLIRAALERKP